MQTARVLSPSRPRFCDAPIRQDGVTVFVTDFGEVVAGPKFLSLLELYARERKAAKTSKAKAAATRRLRSIDGAVCVLAEAYWVAGGALSKTP